VSVLTSRAGPAPGRQVQDTVQFEETLKGDIMIVLGIVLLIIGYLAHISILVTLGIILALVGAALYVLGSMGHAVGGRRHYW
jgi:uncharacterized membrane protein HdeD (DUF308 family)